MNLSYFKVKVVNYFVKSSSNFTVHLYKYQYLLGLTLLSTYIIARNHFIPF